MGKDINKSVFDDATKLKLDIFGECFEEWFPVFNYDLYTKAVYIFDFFAGSGTDVENYPGSPLILLDKAKGENEKYCSNAKKEIKFFFNEKKIDKSNELKQNLDFYIKQCEATNNCGDCIYKYTIQNYDFQEIFNNQSLKNIFNNKDIGKFVLLDQYGFSQISEDVFKQLVSFPKTDFIFFISSSFINRFKDHPYTKQHIDTSKISFENKMPNEIHRAVADYFRSLISQGKEYYLHHFSIKKGANYYGLIFGSNHTLGMEKFLKVCWKHDKFSGEANFNIDKNWEENSLFASLGENIKKDTVSKEIKELILSGEISDNITGLKSAMHKGCEPKLFTEVIQKLEKDKLIERYGNVNNQSSNIHKLQKSKRYNVKRV